jgi:hypothetical protein
VWIQLAQQRVQFWAAVDIVIYLSDHKTGMGDQLSDY